jgi:hypothetical protein
MNQHEIAQQTTIESGLLRNLVEGLRTTMAWDVSSDGFDRKLSTLQFIGKSFQRHMERLMGLEEFNGYMDIVLETKPSLSKAVEACRRDHDQFRQDARRIVQQLSQIAPTDHAEFDKVCAGLSALLDQLDSHTLCEAKLFQEAFKSDEGGEG